MCSQRSPRSSSGCCASTPSAGTSTPSGLCTTGPVASSGSVTGCRTTPTSSPPCLSARACSAEDGLAELEADAGTRAAELAQHLREHGGRDVGRQRGAQAAERRPRAPGPSAPAGRRRCASRVPRLGQQRATGRRQRDPARAAREELDAELALEPADALAQRRLSHVQALGGAAEVELLRHGDEVPEVAQQVHPRRT